MHPLSRNIPNLITLARIVAVPVIVWLILDDRLHGAFWLFLAAGISDALDGFIAKRYDLVTELGAYLDPIADKALMISVYSALGHQELLPMWLVILVVFRDILIIVGALLFETLTHALKMDPLLISKVNTAAQIVLVVVVLGDLGLNLGVEASYGLVSIGIYVIALTTALSGIAYVTKWGRILARVDGDGK